MCSAHGNASCETRALLGYWRLPGNSIHRVPRLTALLAVAVLPDQVRALPCPNAAPYNIPFPFSHFRTFNNICTFVHSPQRTGVKAAPLGGIVHAQKLNHPSRDDGLAFRCSRSWISQGTNSVYMPGTVERDFFPRSVHVCGD